MPFNMQRRVLAAASLVVFAEGATRTLVQQRSVGECAQTGSTITQYFVSSTIDLVSGTYRQLGSTIGNLDNPIVSAKYIEIDYGSNFKVLTEKFAKEQYVLTQCGTTQPTTAQINSVKALPSTYTRKFFTIPLQQVRAESTVQLGFLESLGLQDRVTQVSQYAVAPCWLKSISCGGLAFSGNATQRNSVDAFFADCPWDSATSSMNCASLHSMPTAIHFSASQDPAPLHSAEHVKFMAAFFNKEKEAQTIFNAQITAMNTLQASAASNTTAKPVVAWIEKDWAGKAKLNTPNYQKLLVEHAGGVVVDAAAVKAAMGNSMSSSYTTSDKAGFFAALKAQGVSAVIDLTYSSNVPTYDYNTFLTNFGLTTSSDLLFIQGQKVFRVDAQISGTSNLDWFESRLVYPDTAVKGLQRVLTPDSSKPKKFFRNIATGEVADVMNKTTCSQTLMTCQVSSYPTALPMINGVAPVTANTVHQFNVLAPCTILLILSLFL